MVRKVQRAGCQGRGTGVLGDNECGKRRTVGSDILASKSTMIPVIATCLSGVRYDISYFA